MRTQNTWIQLVSLVVAEALLLTSLPLPPSVWAASTDTLRTPSAQNDGHTPYSLEAVLRAPDPNPDAHGLTPEEIAHLKKLIVRAEETGTLHTNVSIPSQVRDRIQEQVHRPLPLSVRLYVVDLGEHLGLPRRPGVTKAVGLDYAFGVPGVEGGLDVYVTKAFYERHLVKNEWLFAEVLDHEYTEVIEGQPGQSEGVRHRATVAHLWKFVNSDNAWGISEFQQFFLDLLAANGDTLTLGNFLPDHPNDPQGKFLTYAQHLLKVRSAKETDSTDGALLAMSAAGSTPAIAMASRRDAQASSHGPDTHNSVEDHKQPPTRPPQRLLQLFRNGLDNILFASRVVWFVPILFTVDQAVKIVVRDVFPVDLFTKGGVLGRGSQHIWLSDSFHGIWIFEGIFGIEHGEHLVSPIPNLICIIAGLQVFAFIGRCARSRSGDFFFFLLGLSIVFSGWLSNTLDLILFGTVTNWLAFPAGITNLADIYQWVGAGLITFWLLQQLVPSAHGTSGDTPSAGPSLGVPRDAALDVSDGAAAVLGPPEGQQAQAGSEQVKGNEPGGNASEPKAAPADTALSDGVRAAGDSGQSATLAPTTHRDQSTSDSSAGSYPSVSLSGTGPLTRAQEKPQQPEADHRRDQPDLHRPLEIEKELTGESTRDRNLQQIQHGSTHHIPPIGGQERLSHPPLSLAQPSDAVNRAGGSVNEARLGVQDAKTGGLSNLTGQALGQAQHPEGIEDRIGGHVGQHHPEGQGSAVTQGQLPSHANNAVEANLPVGGVDPSNRALLHSSNSSTPTITQSPDSVKLATTGSTTPALAMSAVGGVGGQVTSLYEINGSALLHEPMSPTLRIFLRRFSMFKYGAAAEIEQFANELVERIIASIGEEIARQPSDWVVVSPPYSTIPHVMTPLAERVASRLGVAFVPLKTPRQPHAPLYPAMPTVAARLAARQTRPLIVETPEQVRNRRVLLIDDAFFTGVTSAYLRQALVHTYHARTVETYTVVRFRATPPEREEWVNTFLVRETDGLQVLQSLADDPQTVLTPNLFRTMWRRSDILDALLMHSSPSALRRLLRTAEVAYGQEEYQEQMQRLRDRLVMAERQQREAEERDVLGGLSDEELDARQSQTQWHTLMRALGNGAETVQGLHLRFWEPTAVVAEALARQWEREGMAQSVKLVSVYGEPGSHLLHEFGEGSQDLVIVDRPAHAPSDWEGRLLGATEAAVLSWDLGAWLNVAKRLVRPGGMVVVLLADEDTELRSGAEQRLSDPLPDHSRFEVRTISPLPPSVAQAAQLAHQARSPSKTLLVAQRLDGARSTGQAGPSGASQGAWRTMWGASFDDEAQGAAWQAWLHRADDAGRLGATLVEVGSSAHPLTGAFAQRRVIHIDLVAPQSSQRLGASSARLRGDIEHPERILDLGDAADVLGLTATTTQHADALLQQRVDSVILPQILNYVDFRRVIRVVTRWLVPGGRLFIINQPGRAPPSHSDLLSPQGVHSNRELVRFLEAAGYVIESAESERDDDRAMIRIIARDTGAELGTAREAVATPPARPASPAGESSAAPATDATRETIRRALPPETEAQKATKDLGDPEVQAGHTDEISVGGGKVTQPVSAESRDMQRVVGEQPVPLADATRLPQLAASQGNDAQGPLAQFGQGGSAIRQVSDDAGVVSQELQPPTGGKVLSGADLSPQQSVPYLGQNGDRGHADDLSTPEALAERGAGNGLLQEVIEKNVGVDEHRRTGGQVIEPGHLGAVEVGLVSGDDRAGGAGGNADDATGAADRRRREADHQLQGGVVPEGQLAPGLDPTVFVNGVNTLGDHASVSSDKTVTSLDESVKPAEPDGAHRTPGEPGQSPSAPPAVGAGAERAGDPSVRGAVESAPARSDAPSDAPIESLPRATVAPAIALLGTRIVPPTPASSHSSSSEDTAGSAQRQAIKQMLPPGTEVREPVGLQEAERVIAWMEQWVKLYPEAGSPAMYLQQLRLLEALGVLTKHTRVFNVLSGVDLFPALFAGAMWTSDIRLSRPQLMRGFAQTHQSVREAVEREPALLESLPPLKALGIIYHDNSDKFETSGIRRWAAQMRQGDVLLLKHVWAYLKTSERAFSIKRWLQELVEMLPVGVRIVVIESPWGPGSMTPTARTLLESERVIDEAQVLLPSALHARFQKVQRLQQSATREPGTFTFSLERDQRVIVEFDGDMAILRTVAPHVIETPPTPSTASSPSSEATEGAVRSLEHTARDQ